ncbi:MAG: stage 0 sporulation family protein [Clostridia bacterium]
MSIIVGVKFKKMSKIYYFDPSDIAFEVGEGVIVETARGIEYGTVAIANKDVSEEDVVLPLKPVIRKAVEEDVKQVEQNEKDKIYAIKVCKEMIEKRNLVMKLIDAEYTFDRSKVIYYFTAEGRVDFRDLVKDIASVLRIRIELRQIYERDDIKIRGALAPCGRPCCCANHLQDFEKVSIKMAKTQGLALNPAKISGVCGKLMCCLKYENDYYEEMNKIMPKYGAKIQTADGLGYVENVDVIKCQVKAKIEKEDGSYEYKTYKIDEYTVIGKGKEFVKAPINEEVSEDELKNIE